MATTTFEKPMGSEVETLNNKLTNDVDISSQFTLGTGCSSFIAKVKNNIVSIVFVTKKFDSAGSIEIVSNIPSSYRPRVVSNGLYMINAMMPATSGDAQDAYCIITNDGKIAAYNAKATYYGMYGSFTYQI